MNTKLRHGIHEIPLIKLPVELPDESTRSMLVGLAGLHQFVFAVDSTDRVSWLNDELDRATLCFDGTRLYQLFSDPIGNAIQHGTPTPRGLGKREQIEIAIENVDHAGQSG